MAEKEQNNINSNENSDSDDDFDSLSPDEKAAFEKIMAEIATETGADSPVDASLSGTTAAGDSGGDSPVNEAAEDAVESVSNETESKPDSDNDTADVNAPSPGDGDESEDEDTLTEDQQAALDKIMAEISGDDASSQPASDPEPSDPETPSDEDLTDDQQAALDKIMSEINSQPHSDEPETTDEPDPPEPGQENEDELTSDQQAALDSIMSEIESKKTKDMAPASNESDSEEEPREDTDSGDQEKALQSIMAEIEQRKSRERTIETVEESESTEPAAQDTPEETPEAKQDDNLSLDEFNKELTALLAGDQQDQDATDEKPALNKTAKDRSVPLKELFGEYKEQEPTADEAPQPAEQKESDAPDESAEQEKQPDPGYVHFKEIDPSQDEKDAQVTSKAASVPQKTSKKSAKPFSKRILVWASLAIGAFGLAAGGYWWFQFKTKPDSRFAFSPTAAVPADSAPSAMQPAAREATAQPAAQPANPPADRTAAQITTPSATSTNQVKEIADSLQTLMDELDDARNRILSKTKEILELKIYYQQGIEDEAAQIAPVVSEDRITTISQAVSNSKVELALRSIQRRQSYLQKLDTPLKKLEAASEELLYLRRRTELLTLLADHVTSFALDTHEQMARQALEKHLDALSNLSVEDGSTKPVSVDQAWQAIADKLKNSQQGQGRQVVMNKRDQAIGKEICSGNFEHKYQLTSLTTETAQCLLKWNGKDLYLNELRYLSPEAAKILSQWPGEWLSLNGLKELSADTAGFLSKWPGRRLSLNGLKNLSAEATAHLSSWHGQQLEMVGLESIGRWENYGTRLFLSEKLKRKLEVR